MRFALLAVALAWPLAADTLVIRNATIHPVTAPDIPNGTVVVTDGKIAAVGARVAAPKGARIIDAKGLHVYPGMIDSATEVGLSEVNALRETVDTNEIGDFNPQLRALVAVNPDSEHLPVVRANGITSVIALPASPGASTMIAGQAALIHLNGWTWEDLAVNRAAAIELVFPTIEMRRRGGGGMGMPAPVPFNEAKTNYEKRLAELTAFFDDARRYRHAKLSGTPLERNLKFEAMIPVLEGKMPLMIVAVRERAIREAIKFIDAQKIKAVIAGAREFGSTLPDLKSRGIAVITPETMELPINEDDPYDSAATLPAKLSQAGVKFAFGTFSVQFARNLPYQAATAVAYGLPYQEALKAVTINAAEIWGVADQTGSIDTGKWADLVIADGDILETRTQIKHVFIKGRDASLENRQTRLYEKYKARP